MQVVSLTADGPIREPVTKFGGQPVWLHEPQWPIGRTDGQPMRFVCQVILPESFRFGGQRIAYVFMTDNVMGESWNPEAGDNAVILQPALFDMHVETRPLATGPTLERMVPGPTPNRLVPQEVEYRALLTDVPDQAAAEKPYQLTTRIGGRPGWLQNEEAPAGGPWTFLMQIDSCTKAYSLNFGDGGVGYLFVSNDGRAARFLWQCA